jgi:NAD(P)-dependent dehydrogenase (short-subunit alcohol dehydrogenase family)
VADKIVAETVRELGGLDILINNAGEQHWAKEIGDISEEQLKRTFQTNIFAMFYLVQAARPHLKEGSAIVNCTSVTMYQGAKVLLDYSATKGAITAFTRSLSENLIEHGIRVNGVGTGPDLDAAQPVGRLSAGEDEGFRRGHADGAARPAQRGGARFPVPGVRGFKLHVRQVLHPNGGDDCEWMRRGHRPTAASPE